MDESKYIELLFEPNEKLLAIRNCSEVEPTAIKWFTSKENKAYCTTKSCRGFSNVLFSSMEWDYDCRYKMYGVKRSKGNSIVVLFDLNNAEKIKSERIEEAEEAYIKTTSILDDYYKQHFGNDIYADLYAMRLYMMDQLKRWNLNADSIPIESDDAAYLHSAKELVQQHLNKLEEMTRQIYY